MTARPSAHTALIALVIDTLLPGDDGHPPLPSGTEAGVTARIAARMEVGRDADALREALDAITRRAGGEQAFASAGPSQRADAIRATEREVPAPFAALLTAALEEYYDSDAVILAMGWRLEPPQPSGHALPPFDETLLDPVKLRVMIWRDARPTN